MVGPAGKKNKKEWRLAGGPGKRKREVGVELEGGFRTLETSNFYLKTKALKQSKQMQRHACIQTLGEF
jgi:hypothetical protein